MIVLKSLFSKFVLVGLVRNLANIETGFPIGPLNINKSMIVVQGPKRGLKLNVQKVDNGAIEYLPPPEIHPLANNPFARRIVNFLARIAIPSSRYRTGTQLRLCAPREIHETINEAVCNKAQRRR